MLTIMYVAQIFKNCCFICNKKTMLQLEDAHEKEFGELR